MTTRKPQPAYTDEQIELALCAIAYSNGNTGRAARELKAAGLKIDPKTLWSWSRKQYIDRYERVRSEVLPKVREKAAETHREIAERQLGVLGKMTDRLEKEVGEIPAKDLPKGVQSVATSAAINVDKAQLLGGGPTHRIERSASEILRSLKAKGMEFLDAEVVSEEDLTDPRSLEGGA
jgi:hypothetical protein